MFRADHMPTHCPGGFFEFYDNMAVPLLREYREADGEGARCVAHHVIAPGLAPGDIQALRQVADGSMDASAVVIPEYRERISHAACELGCMATRLQIAPLERTKVKLGGVALGWQYAICEQINREAGEGSRVAWWGEQADAMAAALARVPHGLALRRDFVQGVERNYPVGGHWAIYGDARMQKLLLVAEVLYDEHQGVVTFEGFNVFRPEWLTPETRRYVRFWRNVHRSSTASAALRKARRLAGRPPTARRG